MFYNSRGLMRIGILSNQIKESGINNNKLLTNSLEKLSTGIRLNKQLMMLLLLQYQINLELKQQV